MACLAHASGELVPTSTLATKADVPANYLAKVLQQLAAAGLIHGRRGVGGGYRLARDASDISLLDIVRTVGDLEDVGPREWQGGCEVAPLVTTLDRVRSMVSEALDGVTLGSLVTTRELEAAQYPA